MTDLLMYVFQVTTVWATRTRTLTAVRVKCRLAPAFSVTCPLRTSGG